ncbi:polysaccharide deacetylase family protein [Salinimicrobium tongyeongense]|uniref:Polysaccharide deacetylase family protein n=1 Tax=Salinimicrobium tongyeongense TaxID=2809707 RepID=A0ABY6NRG5_9FLAO|nr:polysaccharide deacetylase family protein [Salinimicrobium tongyeongense]UZH55506.1 polysaccharide deacetylase family protein [Salinimicrobium tongyeongense]
MKNGAFVISLDFELLWGVFDVVDYKKKVEYFENTRKFVPLVLKSFEQYGIHATWAVVGMLFNDSWEEWKSNYPAETPSYNNPSLSAYRFGESIISSKTKDLVFAPQLIQQIKETPGQEVGTHTYSHYYCREQGQRKEEFALDLHKALEVAKKLNIKLSSLVFPRNQFKVEYLKICMDMGIKNVRSNPVSWYWQDTQSISFSTRLFRSGDAYLPFGKKTYSISEIPLKSGLPVEQMASRFFRPVEGNWFLRKLKLERIKNEMTMAAKNQEIYHLWWHPHNFGDCPAESLIDLNLILDHFYDLQKKYDFQTANMEEIGEYITIEKSHRHARILGN